jgi:hypothetical protein
MEPKRRADALSSGLLLRGVLSTRTGLMVRKFVLSQLVASVVWHSSAFINGVLVLME